MENYKVLLDAVVSNIAGEGKTKDSKNIYTVELDVDEENVTGEKIPVTVEKVTKTGDSTEVSEGLTYTYYLNGEEDGTGEEGKTHTFGGTTELNEKESYTVKARVEDGDGNYGEAEVKFISFGVDAYSLRCKDGMTWNDLLSNSNYADSQKREKWKSSIEISKFMHLIEENQEYTPVSLEDEIEDSGYYADWSTPPN